MRFFRNVVAFSATLKPFEYYAKLSGFNADKLVMAEYASPFPKDNRKILLIPQVSTKYSERDANYAKIGDAIAKLVQVKPGNYFVFFPSYEFLDKVSHHIKAPDVQLLRQSRNLSNADALALLESLRRQDKATLMLAVQGGIFSEGIDMPGDALIGAIIVGPGLPNFDFERELLRKYYDLHYGNGFDYAYVYPAMAKVIQCAGRVIRSEKDRGLIVLMDKRFKEPTYSSVMPDYWFEKDIGELISTKILDDLNKFWYC
jgi:DNA excision repair protein ERCC-2